MGVDRDPGAMNAALRPSDQSWSHSVALYVAFAVIGAWFTSLLYGSASSHIGSLSESLSNNEHHRGRCQPHCFKAPTHELSTAAVDVVDSVVGPVNQFSSTRARSRVYAERTVLGQLCRTLFEGL